MGDGARRRWTRRAAVGAVALLALTAGCSSDDGDDGGAAGSDSTTTTEAVRTKADPTGGAAHDEPDDPSGATVAPSVVVRTELAPPEDTTPPPAEGEKAVRGTGATSTTTTPTSTTTSTTAPTSTSTTTTTPTSTEPPTTTSGEGSTTVPDQAGCDQLPNDLEVQVCLAVGARVADGMASTDTPGMVVGVVVPGGDGQPPVQLELHYGDAVVADGSTPAVPADDTTIWEMGSETKLFTGLLLAWLAPTDADGTCAADAQVCLDDPISDHLPADIVEQIGAEKAGITLLQLATHTSGLPDDPPNLDAGCPDGPNGKPEACADWRALYTDELMWDGVADAEMAFSPGEAGQWLYSDLGFAVLGAVLAGVVDPDATANPFAAVVAEDLTGPLGLTDTGPEDVDDPLLAMGYEYETASAGAGGSASTTTDVAPSGTVVPAPRWDNTNAFIAGGGFTTDISDVTRYVAVSLGYEPSDLTPALAETLVSRTNGESDIMTMGLAWQLMSPSWFPTTYGFKNGGTYGFKSATVVVPTLGYGVTMLSNSPGAPDPIVTGIMKDLQPLLT